MFIARRTKAEPKLHWGEMRKALVRAQRNPAPSGRPHVPVHRPYRHFVSMGLLLVLGISCLAYLRDSNVAASSAIPVNASMPTNISPGEPQDQNIDFSKFLHSNT